MDNFKEIQDKLERYLLIPRTLVFVKYKGKYIFIEKDFNNSFIDGSINGVGGHIEMGEDPFSSARREVFEETGLSLTKLELIALLFSNTTKNPGIIVFIFRAESKGGKIKESEEGRIIACEKNEIINEQKLMKDVPYLLDLCEKHKQNSRPLILMYHSDNNGELRIVTF